ncbi:MAG TPA: hypothetical protein VMR41_02570 [Patescibacteria group bacterium]|nr:hypothetical protein [Patescibacteria group bacterium]
MPTKLQLSFTKVAFPPTPTAWVHTYTAGSFFAVASLSCPVPPQGDDLNALGKDIFANLEAEFFTLENKDLASIKEVISQAIKNLPSNVAISFVAAYIRDTTLYVFVAGAGSVVIKRGGKLATILSIYENDNSVIKAASGHIQVEDMLFLQTQTMSKYISLETILQESDRLPNEIAESFANQLQSANNNTAGCIIVKVEGIIQEEFQPQTQSYQHFTSAVEKNIIEEKEPLEQLELSPEQYQAETFNQRKTPSLHLPPIRLPHINLSIFQRLPKRTRVALGIALILLLLLAASIIFHKQTGLNNKNEQVFNQYYPEAKKYVDSANAIASVDSSSPSIQTSLQQANNMLKTAQQQLTPGSTQAKQVNALLQTVTSKLQGETNIQQVSLNNAVNSDSALLAAEIQHSDAKYFTTDGKSIYYINAKGIYNNSSSKALLTNDGDWNKIGGLGTYFGNFYVLDKTNGVLKYVSGADGYGKTNYFATGVSPDLSSAVNLTIDNSIYILFTNGAVTKYTRDQPDTFNLKGLGKPFSSPTRILTNENMNNIYVLDNGNDRIVQLGKDGTFEAQYVNSAFHTAKDIDVNESSKTIYILTSDNKIESITIK